jgi:hypothetical protein
VWLGAGLVALGIDEGDRVTEAQMRALLGEGLHPNADAIIDAVVTEQVALGAKFKDAIRYALKQAQLGRPYSRTRPRRAATGTNVPRNSPTGTPCTAATFAQPSPPRNAVASAPKSR